MYTSEGNRAGSRTQSMPRSQTQGGQQRSQFTQKNTVEVPMTEILRIQQKCYGAEENYKLREKQDLQVTLEKSKERVKKWPNTINALRKKKDATRFERFKVDEEERRRVEQDEAQYQAQVKKEILEKANRQIYENNDRVRSFQSKLLLTDIHQEREGMVELKQFKTQLEKQREELFNEQMKEQLRQAEELEDQKKQEQLQKKRDAHKVLKEQHDEMKNKYVQKLQEEKIEGELLKIKVQEMLEKEEEAARDRRLRQLQNQADIKKGNDVLQEIKQREHLKEQAEEARIAEHAAKKENITRMRRVREEQKFKEKQAERQKLIDVGIMNLQKAQSKRDQILDKQIVEARIKADNAERLKEEKRKELVGRIEHSRKLASEIKTEEMSSMKKNNQEFQSYWKTRNVELEDIEKKEKEEMRLRNLQLRDFHLSQASDKMKQREQAILNDIEEQQNILRKQENEDKVFGSWAERCIREWSESGKAVRPLIKELTQYKAK